MTKSEPKVRKVHGYNELSRYIEDKYSCNLRDYYASKHGIKDRVLQNVKHRLNWEETNYPIIAEFCKNPVENSRFNQAGLDFYHTSDGREFFADVRKKYEESEDGMAKEIPRWDFWYMFLDTFEIYNGVVITVNWTELSKNKEEWQKEICLLFAKEFGEEQDIEFSW